MIGTQKPIGKNEVYEHQKYLREFTNDHDFYWLPYTIQDTVVPMIIVTTKSTPEQWIEKGYELDIYYLNPDENNNVIRLANYSHYLPIVEYENNTICKFYTDGQVFTKQVSHHCSDVAIDYKTNCDSVVVEANYRFMKSELLVISQDTTRYSFEL